MGLGVGAFTFRLTSCSNPSNFIDSVDLFQIGDQFFKNTIVFYDNGYFTCERSTIGAEI